MSQILSDLILGEFQQMSPKGKTHQERFDLYLDKTYNKTASLIANSSKSVALLATQEEPLVNAAFQFGKNIGIAFQLVDDWLDFTGSVSKTGKPVGIDMKLGIATGPVLFACEEHPELEALINRRFQGRHDVDTALEMVLSSNGISRTLGFAKDYAQRAIQDLKPLANSSSKNQLFSIVEDVIRREN